MKGPGGARGLSSGRALWEFRIQYYWVMKSSSFWWQPSPFFYVQNYLQSVSFEVPIILMTNPPFSVRNIVMIFNICIILVTNPLFVFKIFFKYWGLRFLSFWWHVKSSLFCLQHHYKVFSFKIPIILVTNSPSVCNTIFKYWALKFLSFWWQILFFCMQYHLQVLSFEVPITMVPVKLSSRG